MNVFDLFDNEFGGIGEAITVDLVKKNLSKAKGGPVTFRISTLGGDANEGIMIHDLIKEYKGETKAIIYGMTASAGTIIAMGCDTVESRSLFLIHNSNTDINGNSKTLRKAIKELDHIDNKMISIYKNKTGLSDNVIRELMAREDWLTPSEAKEFGFVDLIQEDEFKIAASIKRLDNIDFSNILITKLKNKMFKFKAKKEGDNPFVLALKDGISILADAEEPAEGVQVSPIGQATLEDGEYELSDGRIIVVSGGVISEVKEKEEEPSASGEEIIEAVAEMITESEAKIEAIIESKIKAMKSQIKSSHTPFKSERTDSGPKASVHDKISQAVEAINNKIEESKKA